MIQKGKLGYFVVAMTLMASVICILPLIFHLDLIDSAQGETSLHSVVSYKLYIFVFATTVPMLFEVFCQVVLWDKFISLAKIAILVATALPPVVYYTNTIQDDIMDQYICLFNVQVVWLFAGLVTMICESKLLVFSPQRMVVFFLLVCVARCLAVYQFLHSKRNVPMANAQTALLVTAMAMFYYWFGQYLIQLRAIFMRRKVNLEVRWVTEAVPLMSALLLALCCLFYTISTIINNHFGYSDYKQTKINFFLLFVCAVCIVVTQTNERITRQKFQEAQDAVEMKKGFVRYIGHEIRTPLNVASIGLEMLCSENQARKCLMQREAEPEVFDIDANKPKPKAPPPIGVGLQDVLSRINKELSPAGASPFPSPKAKAEPLVAPVMLPMNANNNLIAVRDFESSKSTISMIDDMVEFSSKLMPAINRRLAWNRDGHRVIAPSGPGVQASISPAESRVPSSDVSRRPSLNASEPVSMHQIVGPKSTTNSPRLMGIVSDKEFVSSDKASSNVNSNPSDKTDVTQADIDRSNNHKIKSILSRQSSFLTPMKVEKRAQGTFIRAMSQRSIVLSQGPLGSEDRDEDGPDPVNADPNAVMPFSPSPTMPRLESSEALPSARSMRSGLGRDGFISESKSSSQPLDDDDDILLEVQKAIALSTQILDDLLAYDRIDSQAMSLEKTMIDMPEFVLASLGMFSMYAANKSVEFDVSVQEGLPAYFGDVCKLRQVLCNLASNAVKFTAAGGSVSVDVKHVVGEKKTNNQSKMAASAHLGMVRDFNLGYLQITFTDSGVGIAPENIGKVFKQVIQFDANVNQGGKGTGLGLYITRGLVELHGGTISVTSDGLGKGCVFKIRLPYGFQAGSSLALISNRASTYVSGVSSNLSYLTTKAYRSVGALLPHDHHQLRRTPSIAFLGGLFGRRDSSVFPSHSLHSLSNDSADIEKGMAVNDSDRQDFSGHPHDAVSVLSVMPSEDGEPSSRGGADSRSMHTSPRGKDVFDENPHVLRSRPANNRFQRHSSSELSIFSDTTTITTLQPGVPVDDGSKKTDHYDSGRTKGSGRPVAEEISEYRPFRNISNGSIPGSDHMGYPMSIDSEGSIGNSANTTQRLGDGSGGLPNRDSTRSNGFPALRNATGLGGSKSALDAPQLSGRRVLLVDDSLSSLKMVGMLLKKLGCTCVTATDGDEAIAIVRDNDLASFDFILMDNFMERVCGPEATRQIRAAGYKNLIVGLTGHALGDDLAQFLEAGADEVLAKPLDLASLQTKVQQRLNLQQSFSFVESDHVADPDPRAPFVSSPSNLLFPGETLIRV